MGALDDEGWLILSSGATECKVHCKSVEWDLDDESVTFIDYPADGHYGYSLETFIRIVKIKTIFFDNKTNFDLFLANMKTAQAAGTFTIKVEASTTPTYIKWDGTNHIMPVQFVSMKGMKKVFGGDIDYWEVTMLTVRQAGALASE